MKKLIIITLSLIILLFTSCKSGFNYNHDPMKNTYAMADIVKDENAIYGYKPNETGSLKQYATLDWSDKNQVSEWRYERIEYHKSLESMYVMLDKMTKDGKSIEEIARAISTRRNEIRLEAYKDNPEGLAVAKERNLEKYGHEEGPLPDELYAQYGSWEMVLSKAFSTNSGMDACLGLYDTYYDLYVAVGQVPGDNSLPPLVLALISVLSSAVIATIYFTISNIIRKKRILNR